MLDSECKVGELVVANHPMYYGLIGRIAKVARDPNGLVVLYQVVDMLNNDLIGFTWSNLGHWNLYTVYKFKLVTTNDLANPDDFIGHTTKPISKECPCGIHRSDCDYHK